MISRCDVENRPPSDSLRVGYRLITDVEVQVLNTSLACQMTGFTSNGRGRPATRARIGRRVGRSRLVSSYHCREDEGWLRVSGKATARAFMQEVRRNVIKMCFGVGEEKWIGESLG
jgi:hypothetical protein